MPVTASVQEFLRCANVPYSVLPHAAAYSAQDEAAVTHTPGRDWAKAVVCFADDEPIQAVVPADRMVDFMQLLLLTGADSLRLAREDELAWLYPECDRGAMPPLGPLYKQRVFVDRLLAAEPRIVFDAGSPWRCNRHAICRFRSDNEPDCRHVLGTGRTATEMVN